MPIRSITAYGSPPGSTDTGIGDDRNSSSRPPWRVLAVKIRK
jgi:hypothetical protein